jgi:hypothetical protein
MIRFFRNVRKKLFAENRISRYLLYAFGEIILVVVGILIAIQIDGIYRDWELADEERDNYKLVIADLRRDSTLFAAYQKQYTGYLDTYFKLNAIEQGEGSFKGLLPDLLVSNIEFNPVTQNNHQSSIEKLRDVEVRDKINNYFRRLNQVRQANVEFNDLIVRESRPFFLKETNILDNSKVFDDSDRTFPPFRGVSTVDTTRLKQVMPHPYFLPIISQLRMSMGFYLVSLERSIKENSELIQTLEGLTE